MTRDLLSGRHPAFQPDDFTLVMEKVSGRIVSAMGLISQTWSYGGIPFGVGRPELVGTDPDYHNKGLIREQFRGVHKACRERGQLIQAITGITGGPACQMIGFFSRDWPRLPRHL